MTDKMFPVTAPFGDRAPTAPPPAGGGAGTPLHGDEKV